MKAKATEKAAMRIAYTIRREEWDSAREILFAVVGALRYEGFPPETVRECVEKALYDDQGLRFIEESEWSPAEEARYEAELAMFNPYGDLPLPADLDPFGETV